MQGGLPRFKKVMASPLDTKKILKKNQKVAELSRLERHWTLLPAQSCHRFRCHGMHWNLLPAQNVSWQ